MPTYILLRLWLLRLWPAFLCGVPALVLGGCSPFEHDWSAQSSYTPTGGNDIAGRWQGTWTSDSGHNGGLRCLITKKDDATYHARFAATYAGVLHFNYEMDLTATENVDGVSFEGQADLGALAGGVYHYDGQANSEKFTANYHANDDHGQFNMTRPGSK